MSWRGCVQLLGCSSIFRRPLIICANRIPYCLYSPTTIDKTALGNHPLAQEQGGLSGLPVREKSNLVLRRLAEILGSTVPIIGVGGIVCGEDAAEKLRLGATAVQLYSGLIYRGPELVRECMDSCR